MMQSRSLSFHVSWPGCGFGAFGSVCSGSRRQIAEAEARQSPAAQEIRLVIDQRGALLFGCSERHHQRDQMILAGVSDARIWCEHPGDDALAPFSGRRLKQRLLQPIIEAARWLGRSGAPQPEVVKTRAAADNHDAFVAQRSEQPSDR